MASPYETLPQVDNTVLPASSMQQQQPTKKTKKKIDDFRVWTQTKNLKGQDTVYQANQKQRTIKHYANVLNGEDLHPQHKYHRRNKQKLAVNLIPSDIQVSDKCRTILNDIYQKINFMKEGTQQVAEFNSMFLKNQNDTYLKTQLLPSLNNNNVEHVTPPSSATQTKINAKRKLTNFIYINDNYRRQLNKAFNTFNPFTHLVTLNMLKKDNDELKHNLNELNTQIDSDIKALTSKDFYRKKYQRIKNMFNRERLQTETKDNHVDTHYNSRQQQQQQTTSKMNKTSSTAFRSMSNTHTSFMKKQMGYISPKKRQVEHKEKEIDLMVNALDKINNTLEIEPVVNYINDYKKHKNVDIKDRKREYFPGFEHAERILKKIASSKISKENEKTTEDITSNADYENSLLLKQLELSKGKLISEI